MSDGDEVGFVLIPGAGLGTWVWDRVIAELDRPALPVAIPGRGSSGRERRRVTLATAADEVADAVRSWNGPARVAVVGHSIGGVLVPELARRLGDRVAALVFVGAIVPADEGRALELMSGQARFFVRLFGLVRPGGMTPPAGPLKKELCNDLDEATTALVVERFEPVPEAARLYRDAVSWDGVPDVSRCYVQLLRDKSVPPADQARMAAAIGAAVTTIDSGHLPMLGRPSELATALRGVVTA